jgi:hypothetical protein
VNQHPLDLPGQVGEWNCTEAPERITSSTIFDYMNGAGELYLAYRFLHLDVYRYVDAADEEILVELYHMETSDDAFGLLSLDWGGERIELNGRDSHPNADGLAPARALYGAGLLRTASGRIYARIMAYRESQSSRQAILAIARVVDSSQPRAVLPELLSALPADGPSGFVKQPDRFSFFRSHLILNSIYFLSLKNILGLSKDAEAVTATYLSPHFEAGPVRLVLIRYPNPRSAEQGLHEFQAAYLSDGIESAQLEEGLTRAIEDGWTGLVRLGRAAALVFESPDEATARQFLEECRKGMVIWEAKHD